VETGGRTVVTLTLGAVAAAAAVQHLGGALAGGASLTGAALGLLVRPWWGPPGGTALSLLGTTGGGTAPQRCVGTGGP
jgi:hypothetical protein